jgi:hypothetical protein
MSSTVLERLGGITGEVRNRHRLRISIAVLSATLLLSSVAAYGWDYYGLEVSERAYSPKHDILRPSGTMGLRLGMFGVFLFFCLYLYPLRKRWAWLRRFGKTKHWLDFHVLFGITAPLTITLHSSLKFQGLAGVAYWLMIAVMLSGIVGRYLYAKIPRSISSAELSLTELEKITERLTLEMESQSVLSGGDAALIFRIPSVEQVRAMWLPSVILHMVWLDIVRVFRVSAVRRRGMSGFARLRTLNGFMPSRDRRLEDALKLVRQRARTEAKIAFLDRTNQMFHLWHVVHRPFSYSFALLAVVHIVAMALLGYY